MAITAELDLDGMTPNVVFEKLLDRGISRSDAAVLIGGWIFNNFGKAKRVFNYAEPFPAVQPACTGAFQRSFQHADWVDGESLVQAEQSVGEEGFNARFHRIEADLDALGTDVSKAFACLAEMRASLRKLLDEVRAELNRLNNDVHECCHRTTRPGVIVDPFPNFGGLIQNTQFVGTSVLNGKTVSIWQTNQGMMMLPGVSTIGIDVLADFRVTTVGQLARMFAETKAIQDAFPGPQVSKRELVQRFGAERAGDGRTLRELVAILPDAAVFGSLDQMVDAVAEREAAVLRTTGASRAAVADAFGLQTEVETVAKASVDRFQTIPSRVREVLIRKGVDTMEKLGKVSANQMIEMTKAEGIDVSRGEAAEWLAGVKTLNQAR
jgi:hypothetical protein